MIFVEADGRDVALMLFLLYCHGHLRQMVESLFSLANLWQKYYLPLLEDMIPPEFPRQ